MYKPLIMEYFENTAVPIQLRELCEDSQENLVYTALTGKTPFRNMKIRFDSEMKSFFREYCSNIWDNFENRESKWVGEAAKADIIGILKTDKGNVLLDFVPVDYESFRETVNDPPEWLKAELATKVHIYDCVKAVAFIVCRNTQKTVTLEFHGEFEDTAISVENKAKELAKGIAGDKVKKNFYIDVESIYHTDGALYGYDLSEYLEKMNEKGEDAHRRDTKIHPSELTYSRCDKRQVYRLLGYEGVQKISPHLRKIFDYGHSIHNAVQEGLIAHNKIEIESKVRHDNLNMIGSCDGVLNRTVLELKSKGHKGFEKLTKPSKEHREQATIYAAGTNSTHISIVYVDKNTAEIKEFIEAFDYSLWDDIQKRVKNILYHVSTKTFPDGIDKKYKCKECPYVETCHPEFLS